MKKNSSLIWVLCFALCLCMALTMIFSIPAVPAKAYDAYQSAVTSNINDHNYTYDRWANPINSYLVDNGDGTLTRVESTGESVAVELFNRNMEFVSGFSVDMELPLFGGYYYGSDRNFLVFGQTNPTESESVEVIRVVSYTRDWKRIGAASLYGANTTIPFDGGSLRFAEYGGYLYIRTAHEMYTASDGRNHQANVMLNIRIADMTITDSFTKVMNISYGYVSHSFDQYIGIDGTKIVAVDHGDANPRAVVLTRYATAAGQDSFMSDYIKIPAGENAYYRAYTEYVSVLPISGSHGANDTGVSIGGFQISNTHYLIAGTTVEHGDNYDAFGQRNIFITATDKQNFSSDGTTVEYITHWTSEDNVTLGNPHMIALEDGNYFLIWTETTDTTQLLKYCLIDGSGHMVDDNVYSTAGVLSDCVPIVWNGKVVWYVTSASAPAFFTIDLSNLNNMTHGHVYSYEFGRYPSDHYEGSLSSTCTVCGEQGPNVVIPAIKGSDEWSVYSISTEPTCTTDGYGYYRWNKLENYDVTQYMFGGSIPASGHSYVDGTCTACGAADPDYVKPVVRPNLTLSYPTLNFKDVVYYNVYYQVSDMTDVVEMGLITFDGALSTGTIDDAAEVITGYIASGSNYMVHTNGINAKNLGDALYFKVYAKLSDGSYVYSDLAGYHAVAYAKDILANSTNAKMKSLVVAMLNYGAAAQVQFEYKTDSLMNSFLTAEQKALVADYSADMVAPVTMVDSSKVGKFAYVSGGYSALYPSVSFEGAFSVKFYFIPAKAMDGDLTMYYWSAADYAAADVLTAENATGVFTMDAISGTYVATVEGIAARQIDETIYVAGIYESNGVSYPTGVIAYSLGTYCLDRVTNGTGNMPAFAKATIVYGYYAKAYFA